MNFSKRFTVLRVLGIIIGLHLILSLSHEKYGRVTSISSLKSHFTSSTPAYIPHPPYDPYIRPLNALPVNGMPKDYNSTDTSSTSNPNRRANATYVILARNSDLEGVMSSMQQMEDRFNRYHAYPYVFLNKEPFTKEFKDHVSVLTNAKVEFGIIPKDHWHQPDWIDESVAEANRNEMAEGQGVPYGGSVGYRNMCRFNSGFFFKHELLQKYKWYWRIEPDIRYHCDLKFDPFLYMEDNGKEYGFTMSMYEFKETVPSLWGHVRDFMGAHPEHIAEDNSLEFLSDDGGESYNLCHFWANFEIANMDFWRGEAYQAFFKYLDAQGGFYYERWGDAPVHSIAAALFLRKDQMHFFEPIGYYYKPFTHCPLDKNLWEEGRCGCNPEKSFDYDAISCLKRMDKLLGRNGE